MVVVLEHLLNLFPFHKGVAPWEGEVARVLDVSIMRISPPKALLEVEIARISKGCLTFSRERYLLQGVSLSSFLVEFIHNSGY